MRYSIFGGHSGLRVSELVLGTANFGTSWGHGTDAAEARTIFGRYAEEGGNFIDVANGYQDGQSELFLGKLLAGRRDDFVVSTKYSCITDSRSGILATGNSRQAMVTSVEASLTRLKTDRIDLFYAHVSDGVTPIEEVMRGFEDLARAGKILYAGLSNFPAWKVSRAATLAEIRGSLPIAAIQVEYSLVARTSEREVIEAAHALGIGVVAWSPLGGGVLTGKYRAASMEERRNEAWGGAGFQAENTPQRTRIIDTLMVVAEECAAKPGEVALAWVASKQVRPIIGPRTLVQLEENLAAVNVRLTPEQVARLDAVSMPEASYPYDVLDNDRIRALITGGAFDRIDYPARPIA